jgi:glycosyltransferase involved in cell wall biosynthesis
MSSTPDLTVVICSLNGAPGVDRCLSALGSQTFRGELETVVVDDGSSDNTSEVARKHGAKVLRHERNRGLSAARNSGVAVASAPIVAFLDDDCDPHPRWAAQLLAAYDEDVIGVGGPVTPVAESGVCGRFLERNNPLGSLELDLGQSEALIYRLKLYLERLWSREEASGRRAVFSLVGANMSFWREKLLAVGLFDTRFTFGAEELDICRRLARAYPDESFVMEPDAVVVHHFEPSLGDTLRRSRAYGRGSARMFRKWPSSRPTFFPFPVLVGGLLVLGLRRHRLLAPPFLVPHLMFPAGLRNALSSRRLDPLLDPYLKLAQESFENVGFIEGLWLFRGLEPQPEDAPTTLVRATQDGNARRAPAHPLEAALRREA